VIERVIGKTIQAISVEDDAVVITFTDDATLRVGYWASYAEDSGLDIEVDGECITTGPVPYQPTPEEGEAMKPFLDLLMRPKLSAASRKVEWLEDDEATTIAQTRDEA
jgi:hypothetical protein